MSFILSGLHSVAQGGAYGTAPALRRTIWSYVSDDLVSSIVASGYFNAVSALMKKGDLIIVSADVDGTPATNVLTVTSADAAATVTTTGLSTVTQTYNARYAVTTTVALTDGDSGYVVAPYAGTISSIKSVLLGGAVTTNNAVVTGKIGSTAITNGVLTITASGSAIGDMDTATPTAANVVAPGDVIKFTVSGTPGGSRTAFVTILIDA